MGECLRECVDGEEQQHNAAVSWCPYRKERAMRSRHLRGYVESRPGSRDVVRYSPRQTDRACVPSSLRQARDLPASAKMGIAVSNVKQGFQRDSVHDIED